MITQNFKDAHNNYRNDNLADIISVRDYYIPCRTLTGQANAYLLSCGTIIFMTDRMLENDDEWLAPLYL